MGFEEFRNSFMFPVAVVFASASTIALTSIGLSYLSVVAETGYWNPARQSEYLNAKREKEKRKSRFDELHKEFVGYADRDKNSYIDFAEQVNAWRRAGYEGPFFESEGASQFPKLTLEGLEKAVASYKNE